MILGFLAVVGKRNVAPEPRQFDGHRSTERDTLVGRAENHVELNAAADQGLCIELRKPAQFGAIIEQAGIEEVGGHASGLGLELSETQGPGLHRKLDKFQCKRVAVGTIRIKHHGDILVQVDQPQSQRHPIRHDQGA
jgi:hypothetical protein